MILLFANNAETTLAAPVTSVATTIVLSPTTGSQFPAPLANQYFVITLTDAATGLINEILWCTGRQGDRLTVLRGQEGTAAKAWLTGDFVSAFPTAGTMADLIQIDQLQRREYTAAYSSGTPSALSINIPSNLNAIPDGFSILVNATATNPGPVTLQVTFTSLVGKNPIVFSPLPIYKNGAEQLIGGEIAGNGYPCELVYSAIYNAFVLTNPYFTNTGLVTINQVQSQFFTYGVATGGSDAITVNIQSGLNGLTDGATIIFRALYNNGTPAPMLTVNYGSQVLAARPIVKNNNQPLNISDIAGTGYPTVVVYSVLWNAWVLQNPSIPASSPSYLSAGGWQKLPSGLIIQWSLFTTIGYAQTPWVYPIVFPNAVFHVSGTANLNTIAQPYYISTATGAGDVIFSNVAAWNPQTAYYATTSTWMLAIGY